MRQNVIQLKSFRDGVVMTATKMIPAFTERLPMTSIRGIARVIDRVGFEPRETKKDGGFESFVNELWTTYNATPETTAWRDQRAFLYLTDTAGKIAKASSPVEASLPMSLG